MAFADSEGTRIYYDDRGKGEPPMSTNCSGSGNPTVVIDAGLGDWSTNWYQIGTLFQYLRQK